MVAGDPESQQVCSESSNSQKVEELCSEGRFKEAEKVYTELLEKAEGEDLALLYNNRGHARYMQVDFPGALEDLERALALNPELAAAHYTWATVTYRLNDCKAALPAFLRAVQLEPENEEFKEGLRSCQKN